MVQASRMPQRVSNSGGPFTRGMRRAFPTLRHSSHKLKIDMVITKYKKQWKHYHDKRRTVASDQNRKEKLLADLKEAGFKNATIIQELCKCESKYFQNISRTHYPDATVEMKGYRIAVELDGPIHGYGDDLTISKKTKERDKDYVRAKIPVIILNEEYLKTMGISHVTFLICQRFNLEQILRAKREVGKESEAKH